VSRDYLSPFFALSIKIVCDFIKYVNPFIYRPFKGRMVEKSRDAWQKKIVVRWKNKNAVSVVK
jgi:hypothetical protein